MAAARYRVDQLVAIVDHNGLQQNGRVPTSALAQQWSAFGWAAQEVNGHDVNALVTSLEELRSTSGRPLVVVARTVKGKGVREFENRVKSHYMKLKSHHMKLTESQAQDLV